MFHPSASSGAETKALLLLGDGLRQLTARGINLRERGVNLRIVRQKTQCLLQGLGCLRVTAQLRVGHSELFANGWVLSGTLLRLGEESCRLDRVSTFDGKQAQALQRVGILRIDLHSGGKLSLCRILFLLLEQRLAKTAVRICIHGGLAQNRPERLPAATVSP